jgi:hypothetical protein
MTKGIKMAIKLIVKAGDRYGRLVIDKEISKIIYPSGQTSRKFTCICDCGNVISTRLHSLRSGYTKSCGCIQKTKKNLDKILIKNKQKEQYKERVQKAKILKKEYKAYHAAKSRCTHESRKDFKHYGGRGIKFNFKSFEEFIDCIGVKPSPKHTLDRIHTDGNYEKGNVRWATQKQQVLNQRRNRFLTFNNETLTVKEWSEKTGIKRQAIHARIDRRGWSVEKALTTPVR